MFFTVSMTTKVFPSSSEEDLPPNYLSLAQRMEYRRNSWLTKSVHWHQAKQQHEDQVQAYFKTPGNYCTFPKNFPAHNQRGFFTLVHFQRD